MTSTYPPATLVLSAAAWLLAAWCFWALGAGRWALGTEQGALDARHDASSLHMRLVLLAVGVHGLLVCALFSEALLHGWTLAAPHLLDHTWPWAAYHADGPARAPNPMTIDLALQFGPWLEHIRARLAEGTLPLWNPLSGAGEPFVALYQSAIFSPFTWLGALAPPPYGLLVIGVLQLLLGGLGMLVLLSALGLSRPAVLIGSTAWLFNSFTIGWLGWPFASVACLFPWLVWAVHRAMRRPDRRRFVLLAAVCGLVLVAGHPETAFKMGLVVVAFVVAGLAASRQARVPVLGLLLGAALAGLLLAAVQVGPFFEYLPDTGKLAQRQTLINASYTPRKSAIVAWVPDFFGPPTGPWLVATNREGTPTGYLPQLVYPGVAIWVLAAVGLVSGWRRWPVKALAVAALLAAGFKYGAPGLVELVRRLPTPLPYFSIDLVFCAAVLGAWGFDLLWRAGDEAPDARAPDASTITRRGPAVWPAVLVALAAATAIGLSLARERDALQELTLWPGTLTACATALALIGITLALIVARQRQWIGPSLFAVLLFAAVVVDLLGFARGYQRLAPPMLHASQVPEIEAIAQDRDLFRVVGLGETLPPNALLPSGVPLARTYDGVGGPRRFNAIIDRALEIRAEVPNMAPTRSPNEALVDLLNIKYLVGPPDLELPPSRYERLPLGQAALYRNREVLPRAFLTDRYVVEPDDALAAGALADGTIDVRHTVVVPEDIRHEYRPEPGALELDRVAIRHYRDDAIEIAVQCAKPRLLLLTDLFSPGWSASIDGAPAPLLRANVAFRLVPVPAGSHTVRFHYAPRAFRIGAWVSGLTALLLAGAALWRPKR